MQDLTNKIRIELYNVEYQADLFVRGDENAYILNIMNIHEMITIKGAYLGVILGNLKDRMYSITSEQSENTSLFSVLGDCCLAIRNLWQLLQTGTDLTTLEAI